MGRILRTTTPEFRPFVLWPDNVIELLRSPGEAAWMFVDPYPQNDFRVSQIGRVQHGAGLRRVRLSQGFLKVVLKE
jgi:hypothetical protein